MQHRPQGAVLAATGLAALVLVLVATPDSQAWVLGAWVLVLAGVSAVAIGVALGFRRQDRLEQAEAPRYYITADWVGGAQLFTVGERAEPPVPEPMTTPISTPPADRETAPAVPPPPNKLVVEPTETGSQWSRYPRVAAAMVAANAIRELLRPSRVVR
jgi:hypothetical protein